MRKLKLDVEALEIDSFSPGADGGGGGTVEAHRQHTVTGYPLSCWQSCWPEDTCPGCTEGCTAHNCGGGGTGEECQPTNTDPGGG